MVQNLWGSQALFLVGDLSDKVSVPKGKPVRGDRLMRGIVRAMRRARRRGLSLAEAKQAVEMAYGR